MKLFALNEPVYAYCIAFQEWQFGHVHSDTGGSYVMVDVGRGVATWVPRDNVRTLEEHAGHILAT